MNFSFTSGNFIHKFNHQNENHQFSSNFNDNHQLRYSNQNLINSHSTSNAASQPGKFHSINCVIATILKEKNGKFVAGFWKMAFYRFFILMTHRENFN